jgi:hypothetical protein
VLSLHLLAAPAWSARWGLGTLLAALAFFAMASGALILPAAIALAALQIALGRRGGMRELAGIALHAVITLALLRDALSFSPHAPASIGAALDSFLVAASWPVAAASWPSMLKIIPAALINAPVLVLALRLLRERPGPDDRRWFALALAGWLALQLLALSYGRPGGTPESRYGDIFLVGVALNAAVWLHLLQTSPSRLMLVASAWLFAVMLGAGQKATNNVIDGIATRVRTGQIQSENVKGFIATGDFAHLAGKPLLHIPFPSAERLRELLSDPRVRAMLPPALTGAPEPRAKTAILTHGPMLLPLGLALLMLASLAAYRRRTAGSTDPPQPL